MSDKEGTFEVTCGTDVDMVTTLDAAHKKAMMWCQNTGRRSFVKKLMYEFAPVSRAIEVDHR